MRAYGFDVAKDQQQQATLGVLEQPVRHGEASLIVPPIVRDEFARNKARIVQDGQRSLSSVLKRAKEVVHQLGDNKSKAYRAAAAQRCECTDNATQPEGIVCRRKTVFLDQRNGHSDAGRGTRRSG
jgi:hypothetical protein